MTTSETTPFRIEIPQAAIDDLRSRLAATRFADQLPAATWGHRRRAHGRRRGLVARRPRRVAARDRRLLA
ncbi:epoxide hydrolase N-terminal domain-containing protein [Cellulosimicrobium sp. Marseille-Q8652]